MNIVEVRYDRKINLGNYESEGIGLTISVKEGDDEQAAIQKAKKTVHLALGITAPDPVPVDKKELQQETKKVAAKKTPAKKKKVRSKKSPIVAYSRDIQLHRDMLGKIIEDIDPNWRQSKRTVNAAKKVSQDMVGKDFLDKGETIKDFIKECKSIYDLACKNDL